MKQVEIPRLSRFREPRFRVKIIGTIDKELSAECPSSEPDKEMVPEHRLTLETKETLLTYPEEVLQLLPMVA